MRRVVESISSHSEPIRQREMSSLGDEPPTPAEPDMLDKDELEQEHLRIDHSFAVRMYTHELAEYERRREEIDQAWTVVCTAHEHDLDQRHRGSFEALEEGRLDWPLVRAFQIQVPGSYTNRRSIEVRFRRDEGVSFEVAGPDRDWVRGAGASIETELGKGIPRWSWLRSYKSGLPFFFILSAFAIALAPQAEGFYVENEFDGVTVGGFAVLFCVGPGALLFWIGRRLFPGFEIYEPGSGPKSTRYLQLGGAAGFQFLLALVFRFA